MLKDLQAYTQFLPRRLVARHQLEPHLPAQPQAEHCRGAVLMADITGYTALTERYSQRPEGVEELKTLLNDFFGRLNAAILGHGGDIISFAGDSVFAVWCGAGNDDAEKRLVALAAQCALAAQRTLDHSDLGDSLFLRMRIVVAAGEFALATVGGAGGKWQCLAIGAPLTQIGGGLAQTEPGKVVLDAHAWKSVAAHADAVILQDGYAQLSRLHRQQPLSAQVLPASNEAAIAALRCYIAAPVLEQLDAGQSGWLAEFRRVSTAFVRVRGIDYGSDGALVVLQAATLAVQAAVDRYEGTFHRVICDDKGTNMLCVWGIPGRAHEDDAARALAAALAMQNVLAQHGYASGIGVTTGRVMCGLSGGGSRFEYTVAGDAVNLAARLMVAAGDGVLCDAATREAARHAFTFDTLAPLQVKGREQALPVWRPRLAASASARAPVKKARFFGRRAEIAQLHAALAALKSGNGAVMTIEGEPGVGKSQLVAEFQRAAADDGVVFLLGHADAIERGTTYYAWRQILRQILESAGGPSAAEQRFHLDTMFRNEPALRGWLPLLNDVLPLGFAQNAVVRGMSEQARAESTREVLLQVIHRAVAARPVVMVLEDAHWMDSMSWNLAASLRQREASLLLVLVTRSGHVPDEEAGRALQAAATPRIGLASFSREDTAALVCDRLAVTSLPDEALALIYQRTDGHPLFSEELAYSLRDSGYLVLRDGVGLLAGGDASVDARNLPATVEGIIAGRVDRLGAGEQLTLKVASILGRNFATRALGDIHPLRPAETELARQLELFVGLDLVHAAAGDGDAGFEFKHIITQEVTYGMMAFAQRRQLHRAAGLWYEGTHATDPGAVYPLLAHHWSRAGEPPKAFHFLHKAGEQAFRRYANREAIGFLEEAQTLRFAGGEPPAVERASCERLLGFARLWLGDIDRSSAHICNSLATLGQPIPDSRGALVLGTLGQFALGARNYFLRRRLIRADPQRAEVAAGIAESLIRFGHIAWFRFDVPMFTYISLRSLNLAERSAVSAHTALIYSVLTSSAGAIPLHGVARRYRDFALEAAAVIDDAGISSQVLLFVSLYHGGLGDWALCIERVGQAEKLSREIGDLRRAEECMVIAGYLQLHTGNIAAAQQFYQTAAKSAQRRGDRQTCGWGTLGAARVQLSRRRYAGALAALHEAAPSLTDRLGSIELQGMSALACFHLGDFAQSLRAARQGLALLRESRPLSFTTLTGTAGVADALIALWGQARNGGGIDRADLLEREARQALGVLRQFKRVYPIGLPQWHIQHGNCLLVSGQVARALKCWQSAADAAERFRMPGDEALAWAAIARHAPGAAATVAHARAAALFENLGVAAPAAFPDAMN